MGGLRNRKYRSGKDLGTYAAFLGSRGPLGHHDALRQQFHPSALNTGEVRLLGQTCYRDQLSVPLVFSMSRIQSPAFTAISSKTSQEQK